MKRAFILVGLVLLLALPAQASGPKPFPPIFLTDVKLAHQNAELRKDRDRWKRSANYHAKLYRQLAAHVRRTWQPSAYAAIHLASAVTGVPESEMRSVARCESNFFPFATNGQYKGIFQIHWLPFGLSPFDPYANALSAAFTVRHDGGWRQWECKP